MWRRHSHLITSPEFRAVSCLLDRLSQRARAQQCYRVDIIVAQFERPAALSA